MLSDRIPKQLIKYKKFYEDLKRNGAKSNLEPSKDVTDNLST